MMAEQEHGHGHGANRNGWTAAKVRWLESYLEDAGLLDPGDVDDFLRSFSERAKHENGARLVARAWVDPGFRNRLLSDANAAIAELGLEVGTSGATEELELTVVENRAGHHHVVVCTLCSCYPLGLLGPSPGWYKSPWYRAEVVRDPRGVLRTFGVEIGANTEISVLDSSAEMRYMVLPQRPARTEHLSETDLRALVTRNGLIGTALV